jgi:hypothetical protein
MGAGNLRPMIVSAAMAAVALVLPVAFHAVGLGSKFLPMLLPLLLNGFLAPWRWAVLTGFCVPWISALATGMPPLYPPVAAIMSVEGAVLGGVAALVYARGRRSVWLALIPAVVAGRAVSFSLTWLVALVLGLPAAPAAVAGALQGLPGVALQLVTIPLVLRALGGRRSILLEDSQG